MPETFSIDLPGRLVSVGTAETPGGVGAAQPAGGGVGQGGDEMAMQESHRRQQAENQAIAKARAALQAGLAEIVELRSRTVKEAEQQIIDLAVDIARKVLMQEIQAKRYEIDLIVKEAMLRVPARQDVLVRLHPDDWTRCEMARESDPAATSARASQRAASQSSESIRFVSDPTVRPAECVIETSEGVVESAVEDHLQDITEVLKALE